MDDDHSHDEPLRSEEEAAIAERVLAQGDAPHALHHLANALFDTVGESTFFDLARRVSAASSIEGLFAPEERNDRMLLAKAVLLHLDGRDAEALPLLVEVAVYCRELRVERWLAPWIRDARAQLDPLAFYNFLTIPSRTTVGRIKLRPTEVRHALDLCEAAEALLVRPDTGAPSMLLAAASSLFRRADRKEEAIRLAERCTDAIDAEVPFTMLALARRAAGDYEGARRAFERGMAFGKPLEAELGRVAWNAGDLEEARRALEIASRAHPEDYELGVAFAWLAHVTRWHDADPSLLARGADIERQVGGPLHSDDPLLLSMPFTGWLPEASDASINGLRNAYERAGPLSRIAVSSLEAPSARLVLAWTIGADDARAFDYSVGRVPSDPDPREPWDDVPFVLWRYDGTDPIPALPPPSEEISHAVIELASIPYYLPRWWQEASRIALRVGVARVRELAAAMVHADRSAPLGFEPWVWLKRQQVAAALLIARIEARPSVDGPAWTTLEAILCGPHDWAVDAAIIAAVELALDHPHLEGLVRVTLSALFDNAPREGHVCWLGTLATCFPRLPRTGGYWRARCDEALRLLASD